MKRNTYKHKEKSEEIKANVTEASFKALQEASKKMCDEAMKDPERYGEKPLILDWGNGIKIPVPISKPGNKWDIICGETKDGTIVPVFGEK